MVESIDSQRDGQRESYVALVARGAVNLGSHVHARVTTNTSPAARRLRLLVKDLCEVAW